MYTALIVFASIAFGMAAGWIIFLTALSWSLGRTSDDEKNLTGY